MRMIFASLLASLLLLGTGCVGSVDVDGSAGTFGAATSGSLVEIRLDGDTLWLFAASGRANFCPDIQDAYPRAFQAVDRWGLDVFDADACNTFWADLDAAWADVLGDGVNLAFMNRREGGNDFLRPVEGGGEVPDDWGVSFSYLDANPYTVLMDGQAGCDASAEGQLNRTFRADTGTMDVAGSDDSGWRLDFDVTLEDEDGADAGEAVGSFAMRSCDVDLSGVTPAQWVLATALATPWFLD